jgi:tRNA(Ile)-lysidine synthetase-like protein
VLSESALSFPLVVRSARAGERIVVGQGISRKVARVLLDAKVPRAVRDQVPVVADRHGEVVLAVGVCAAHNRRARLGEPGALHVFVDISRNSI